MKSYQSSRPPKTRWSGSEESVFQAQTGSIGVVRAYPDRLYPHRNQRQLAAVNHPVMFEAEPANMKGIAVIKVVSLDVWISANLTWRSLYVVVFNEHIEFAANRRFIHEQ